MNIGNITQKKYEDKPYLEMIIRPPFCNSATFTITPVKNKESENSPDYIIYYSYNRKGEKYRRSRVGAIWNEKSEGGLEYKRGQIESPLFPNGKIYITIFKTKVLEGEDPAKITWSHDVLWNPPQSNTQRQNDHTSNDEAAGGYEQNVPVIDIDNDEIPF